MVRGLLVGVGLLVAVAGVVFTFQGVGDIGGSVMTGSTFWVVGHFTSIASTISAFPRPK